MSRGRLFVFAAVVMNALPSHTATTVAAKLQFRGTSLPPHIMESHGIQHLIDTRDETITYRMGGENTTISEFPHQAAWLIDCYKNDCFRKCTASILSADWLIASSVCFPHKKKIFNRNDKRHVFRVGSSDAYEGGQLVYGVAMHVHPKARILHVDMGLVKVEPPIRFGDDVKPIKLADPEAKLQEGDTLTYAGFTPMKFGNVTKEMLQKVDLHFVSHERCNSIYNKKNFTVSDRLICAQFPPGKRSCGMEELGIPLFVAAEGDPPRRLLGTKVFRSDTCRTGEDPYGFTDLRHPDVLSFIESVTGLSL